MASIKLSALISDIRGKSNGSYFAKRNNTIIMANNPFKSGNKQAGKESLQQARGAVAFISSRWQSIEPTDRIAWNNAAALLTWYTKVGEPYTPTGYQYFNQCNLNLMAQGLPPIVTPLIPQAAVNMELINIVINNGYISLVYTEPEFLSAVEAPRAPAMLYDVVVYASWSNSYGTNYPKGGYKKIAVFNGYDFEIKELTGSYEKVFGQFVATGYSYFRIDVLDTGGGILNGSKLTKADSGRSES